MLEQATIVGYCLTNDYLRYWIYDFRRYSNYRWIVYRETGHCLKHAALQNNFPRVIHSLLPACNTRYPVGYVKPVHQKLPVLQLACPKFTSISNNA